jgi:conjugal transfer/entry exclusion protein
MIWQLYQQLESIMMLLGIINNKNYIINQLINFFSSLYSSSWDKTIRCFDIETGQEIVC